MTWLPADDTPQIVAAVRQFVKTEVLPVAPALEHSDLYPHDLVSRMRELGLFGALIPAAYGGLGLDSTTYAMVIEELCRGWMSLAGVINSHTMAALIVLNHGTEEQKRRLLPRFASGEARGGLCLTEPHAGSDVQAIRAVARRRGDHYLVTGTKMFVTNGREGNTFALLARTDPAADPPHKSMSCFIVDKGPPGLTVAKSIGKLGYKGVDTAELVFEEFPVPAANLVGGVEGRGFKQVMSGLETGRINIAARAVGVAQAGLDAALRQSRQARPDAEQHAAHLRLADMATRLTAARLLTYWAAAMKDRGQRCDLEAGMAKLFASEAAHEIARESMRLHGGDGYLTEHPVERLYRDTPLMLIGEGTNEIQRLLIARQLLERYGERLGALRSLEEEPAERRHLLLGVRQFVEKEIAPVASRHDQRGEYPREVVEKLGELGLFGAGIPQEHGGLGLDSVTVALILEELGRGWVAVARILEPHLVMADIVARHGTEPQRRRLLPALARGERRGALALAEAGTRFDLAGVRTVARGDGNRYVVNGAKRFVTNGRHGNTFLLLARTDPAADPPARGLSCFIVDGGGPGFRVGRDLPGLGCRGIDTSELVFEDLAVPAEQLLGGAEGNGLAQVVAGLATARLLSAGRSVGLAQAAFEAALRYSQQRSAFGKPICQHQAIQLKLADMATEITAARLLTRWAAARGDRGEPWELDAAMAALFAAETACQATLEGMRVHGGYGYTTEFPAERYYRDAPLVAEEGGGDTQRLLIARELLRRRAAGPDRDGA